MPIIKGPVYDNFTSIPNSAIRDYRLSLDAQAIHHQILSRSENWKVIPKQLANDNGVGIQKILKCLNQLEEFGYVQSFWNRDENNQNFTEKVRIVFRTPEEGEYFKEVGASAFCTNADCTNANCANAKHTPLLYIDSNEKKISTKERLNQSLSTLGVDTPKPPKPFLKEFEEAWAIYPRKDGKQAAYTAFVARMRNKTLFADLLRSTENYAALRQGQEQQYTKLGSTFFGPKEHFKDYLDNGEGLATERKVTPRGQQGLTDFMASKGISINNEGPQ